MEICSSMLRNDMLFSLHYDNAMCTFADSQRCQIMGLGYKENFLMQEDSSSEDLMVDELDNLETINFDFEGCPIDASDKEGIIDLLTQV